MLRHKDPVRWESHPEPVIDWMKLLSGTKGWLKNSQTRIS